MDIRLMTEEEEELVLNNYGLVYYLANKLSIPDNDFEDMVSIGTVGLIKAAKTFKKDANTKFTTYAARCINNEFFLYHRKVKRYKNDAHLEDIINTDCDGNEMTFADMIPSQETHFTEVMETNDTFVKVVNIILNVLNPTERLIKLYDFAGVNKTAIAKITELSQSYISRIVKRCNRKIKKYFETEKVFQEVFSMEFKDNMYKIVFSSKDVENFDNILGKFLQKVSVNELPSFRISKHKERIVIQTLADLEVFSFIAKLFQELDDYDLVYTENQNQLLTQKDDSKKLKDYMLSKDSFTVKELKEKFPELNISLINGALMYAKKKGQIISVSRGEYIVKKNENADKTVL